MSNQFATGWRHDLEADARKAWAAEGQPPLFQSTVFAADDRPLPAAFTLANQIKFWFNQGAVGSCFANAGTSSILINRSAEVAAGNDLPELQLSRAFTWYAARVLDGSFPSRGDGGTITNTMRALHESGTCLESTLPYKPDHNWLERKPPANAISEAKSYEITGTVDLDYNSPEPTQRLILNGHPPEIGIWWPFGWDGDVINSQGIATGIGRGEFGHALVLIGWASFAGVLHWHILNSHGPIYPVLPAATAATVAGYATARPDKCYAFWVPDKLLRTVAGYGNAEIVAPAGVTGFSIKRILPWELS